MSSRIRYVLACGVAVAVLSGHMARAASDYPTSTVVDYVFGCMMANGQTREALERCSCSFDVLASIVNYEDYVSAETFQRMGQMTGEKGVLFRQTAPARHAGEEIRRAQTEADMRCF